MNSQQGLVKRPLSPAAMVVGAVVGAILILLALFGLLGSWFVIDQGDRGVILRNGAFVRVAEPGLGFKWPIIDSVVKISVRTEKRVYEKMNSYSRDIQLAALRLAVNYRVDLSMVRQVYEQYGGLPAAVDRVLTPRVQDETKVVFARFNAKEVIEKRDQFGIGVEDAIRKSIGSKGLILEGIQIEEIDFSKVFEDSIEARMLAEVEVTKLQQNHEREKVQADIVRTQAQGAADAILAKARAEADAIRLRGDAEAAAIKAKANALQQNKELIELTKAERWNGTLPTTMIPGGSVPMLQIGK